MTGRVARFFDMRLVPDFAGGTVVLQDAYLDARFSDAVRVRVGKDKTPFGYELLIGDPYVMLTERSLASALVPNRDVGVQVLGDLKPGRVTYSAGVMNGVPDGASSTSDVDSNGGKTVVGRVVVHPFTTRGHVLDGFGLHLGASRGHEDGALPSFRTSIGQTWFAYDRATTASGLHTRLTPAALYYVKAFGLFAEYVRSVQEVRRTSVVEVENHGWDVTAAYVLTGEAVTERGVRPAHPFDPTHHQWGAVQVLGRVSALTVDSGAFAGGRTGAVAATTSSRTAHQYSVGLNWYPAAVIKYYAEYEHTTFDGGFATRPAENAVMVRAQVAF
jgi:phosphate-selective porin OprO/OprP